MASPREAAIQLRPYQREWLADRSRRKIAVKSRRIGFTFATTLEIALAAVDHRSKWLIVSRTQDTVKEAIDEVANHLRAMRLAERKIKGWAEDIAIEEIPTDLFFEGVRVMKLQIVLPNRSVIQGVTAAPDALRGYGGNVFLDEFAFHKDSARLWRAASTATMLGHRLIVVSTPNYQQGRFWELCRKCHMADGAPPPERQQGIWSAHWVDIHIAVAQGFPVSIEDCRELADDDDTFLQEYECSFLADGECFIGADLVASAESVDATVFSALEEPHGPLYLGMDIGRRKDRSVIWIAERVGDVLWTRLVTTLVRTSFAVQEQTLWDLLPQVERAAIDESGIGMMLAERARQKFGGKVEPVSMTQQAKERIATATKRAFEDRRLRIPDSRDIRRSINAVKRYVSANGNARFDAPRTEQGHADEFWALALMISAAEQPRASFATAALLGTPIAPAMEVAF